MKLSERLSVAEGGHVPSPPQPAPPAPHPSPIPGGPLPTEIGAQAVPAHATAPQGPSRLAAAAPSHALGEHHDGGRGAQPVDAFAALKERAATALFERMGTRFSDSALKEDELRATARDELIRIVDAEQVPLSAEERGRLVRDVADDVLGYGPLQRLLDDPAVTEIMVNRMDQIYVERKGQLTLTDSRFSSEEHLRR